MATNGTFGINFPFRDSAKGYYMEMTESPEEEIRADFIHLLLTRKGTRYFLPDFGTRLYQFIFEPMDNRTFDAIEAEIRDAVLVTTNDDRVYRVAGAGTDDYTAKVLIEFTITDSAFETRDFVIINL